MSSNELKLIEQATNDIDIVIMVLHDLCSNLAWIAFQTKTQGWDIWKKRMKDDGVFDEVMATVKRTQSLVDNNNIEGLRKFNEEMQSRTAKGEKVASYYFMGYIWSIMREKEYVSLINQMSLVYLVAQFENFLQRLVSILLKRYPAIIEEKTIALKDLSSCEGIEDARNAVVNKEAGERVNEGVDGFAQYLFRMWKLKLDDYERWQLFKERFYRRNMIIHNASLPNLDYREKTGYKGKDVPLEVDREYLPNR